MCLFVEGEHEGIEDTQHIESTHTTPNQCLPPDGMPKTDNKQTEHSKSSNIHSKPRAGSSIESDIVVSNKTKSKLKRLGTTSSEGSDLVVQNTNIQKRVLCRTTSVTSPSEGSDLVVRSGDPSVSSRTTSSEGSDLVVGSGDPSMLARTTSSEGSDLIVKSDARSMLSRTSFATSSEGSDLVVKSLSRSTSEGSDLVVRSLSRSISVATSSDGSDLVVRPGDLSRSISVATSSDGSDLVVRPGDLSRSISVATSSDGSDLVVRPGDLSRSTSVATCYDCSDLVLRPDLSRSTSVATSSDCSDLVFKYVDLSRSTSAATPSDSSDIISDNTDISRTEFGVPSIGDKRTKYGQSSTFYKQFASSTLMPDSDIMVKDIPDSSYVCVPESKSTFYTDPYFVRSDSTSTHSSGESDTTVIQETDKEIHKVDDKPVTDEVKGADAYSSELSSGELSSARSSNATLQETSTKKAIILINENNTRGEMLNEFSLGSDLVTGTSLKDDQDLENLSSAYRYTSMEYHLLDNGGPFSRSFSPAVTSEGDDINTQNLGHRRLSRSLAGPGESQLVNSMEYLELGRREPVLRSISHSSTDSDVVVNSTITHMGPHVLMRSESLATTSSDGSDLVNYASLNSVSFSRSISIASSDASDIINKSIGSSHSEMSLKSISSCGSDVVNP